MISTTGRPSRRRLLTTVGLPILLVLSAACGTTVPAGSSALTGPSAVADGLAAPDGLTSSGGGLATGGSAVSPGTVGGPASSTGGGGSPGAPGTSPARAGTGSGPGGAPGGGTAAAAAAGEIPGIKDGIIKIGVIRVSNAAAAYAAIGASELAGSGFGERMVEALVEEINRTGIKGLKVEVVNYDIDLNDPSTPGDVHQQRACAAWTEDDRVFAAMYGEGEVLDACLAKAGVLEICGGCSISTYDDKQMNALPLLFSPNGVTVNRQVDFYVKGLVEAGYFKAVDALDDPKVGIITYDDPVRQRQVPRLEAELTKRTGLTFLEKGFLPQPDGGEGDARALSALQSFILQFKARGINRVLMLDNSGQAAAYGMQAADKNAYYPRWGFNSTSGPGILFNSGVVPASQLPGMTVVGWQPATDIGLQAGAQLPPGWPACLDLLEKAGITPANDTDFIQAGSNCDAFLFFRDALAAAPGLSVGQFGAGAASLGSRFQSATVYGADQGVGRRDAGNVYRIGAYNSECNCFRYVGPPTAMP